MLLFNLIKKCLASPFDLSGRCPMRLNLIFFLVLFLLVPLTSQAAAIHDAAKKGDVAALEAALGSGADVNASNGLATPLYYAVDGAHLEAVKLLVESGADVNAPTIWGPALMPAVADGKIELVTLLLERGANPNSDFKTKTALHVAAQHGYLDCVEALVEAGANVNARSSSDVVALSDTPIHLAKLGGHNEVADYLMAHGVVLPKPAPISAKLAAADAEKGRALFSTHCSSCHFNEAGKGRKVGPNLREVVGRDKATLSEEGYSAALRAWEGVWTYEDLNIFLFDPILTTPGTFMYVRVPDETERVNLIAYLRTLSDKPTPLPGN
jgi:cytochrome c